MKGEKERGLYKCYFLILGFDNLYFGWRARACAGFDLSSRTFPQGGHHPSVIGQGK